MLAKVGGLEIGGIAGLILGAAARERPVVVDGFISSAGALIAAALSPASRDYMILAHGSAEAGPCRHGGTSGKKPLLDLSMRLGEGTGAAAGDASAGCGVRDPQSDATFESAHVPSGGNPMRAFLAAVSMLSCLPVGKFCPTRTICGAAFIFFRPRDCCSERFFMESRGFACRYFPHTLSARF